MEMQNLLICTNCTFMEYLYELIQLSPPPRCVFPPLGLFVLPTVPLLLGWWKPRALQLLEVHPVPAGFSRVSIGLYRLSRECYGVYFLY